MPSTYSSLKLQLMATGENTTTWGDVTNTNLGTALEEAITGSADVTFASANVTLTLSDTNTTQTARNLRLNCIGTTGGARNLIVPSIEKLYLVNNACGDTITVKNTTGTGVAVSAGVSMLVFNNGTNVVDAVTAVSSLTAGASINLGAGVSTGDVALEVGGARTGNGAAYVDLHGTSGTDYEARLLRSSGVNGTLDVINTGTGQINYTQTGAAAHVFNVSGAEKLRIDGSGSIGIGTIAPQSTMEIRGAASGVGYNALTLSNYVQNAVGTSVALNFDPNGAGSLARVAFIRSTQTTSGNCADLEFGVSVFGTPYEAMRLDTAGVLLLGTTTSAASNTSSQIIAKDATYIQHISGTASGATYVAFNYSAVGIGSITQSGTTAVLFNTTSDRRLKKNITDASDPASLIDAMRVRSFDWKSDGSHQRYGFIAQELAEVAPEAVHQPEDPDAMMGVDYSKLVPMLVKEIQALRARVSRLEALA